MAHGGAEEGHAEPAPLAPLPPALLESYGDPFVGREAELAALAGALRLLDDGRPRLVAIGGEPGVGKSRLARGFGVHAHEVGAQVLFGRCDEEPLERYQPIAEALREAVAAGAPLPLADLPLDAPLLARLLPELAGRLPGAVTVAGDDPETERYRLFVAISALLGAWAARRPLLLICDDVQWADRPTLLLLGHLLRQPPPFRLLVVATYRDTEVTRLRSGARPVPSSGGDRGRTSGLPDLLADLRRYDPTGTTLSRVDLRGLDTPALIRLLEGLAGHELDANSRRLAAELRRVTGGNALFVRELIRHLIETGAIVRGADGRWRAEPSMLEIIVPDTVRDVVLQRTHRLSDVARRVLTESAVIGRDLDLEVLEAVTGIDELSLVDAVDEAVAAGLLVELPGRRDRYAFAHAIVAEALYASLTHDRRVELHRSVGEALEDRRGRDDRPPYGELARHLAEAGDAESVLRALRYAIRAGQQALEGLAFEEAVIHLERAVGIAEDLEGEGLSTAEHAELLLLLGRARQSSGAAEEARTTFIAAADLGRRGDASADVLAAAALGAAGMWSDPGRPDAVTVTLLEEAATRPNLPPAWRARVLTRLSNELTFSADRHRRAIAIGEEAVRVAEASGDDAAIVAARWHARSMLGLPVEPARRVELAEDAARTARASGDPAAMASAQGWLLMEHLGAGDLGAAREDIEAYDALLAERRLPFRRWYPVLWRANVALLQGRLEEAEAGHAGALELAGERADALLLANWWAQLFAIRRLQGRLDETRDMLETIVRERPGVYAWRVGLAVALAEHGDVARARSLYAELVGPGCASLPYDSNWLFTLGQLADLAVRFDDHAVAADLANLLAPHADTIIVVVYAAFCDGIVGDRLGRLATLVGRYDDAEAHLEQARRRSRSLGAEPWVVGAELGLAELCDARNAPGDRDRARALRAGALEAAERNGWGGLARRARTAPGARRAPISPW